MIAAPRFRSTEVLLFCGLATMIAVSLQSVMVVRCAQMVFFMIFAAMMGRRVRLLPPAVMLISVVVANLFSPNGRVLFSIWRFDVTFGALRLGLLKGSLLVGLIYVSRVSVGPDLRIPGYFGALFLKAFAYFEKLTEKWPETRGDLLERVDALLEAVGGHDEADGNADGRAGGVQQEGPPTTVSTKGPSGAAAAKGPFSTDGSRKNRRNTIASAVLLIAGWGPFLVTSLMK